MSFDLMKLIGVNKDILSNLYMNGYSKSSLGIVEKGSIRTCEAQALYSIIVSNKYKNIIDIGTGNGFSSLYFCKALSDLGNGGMVETIDITDKNKEKNVIELFRRDGLEGFINFNVDRSDDVIPTLDDAYDFVLIDGEHTYEQTKRDFYNVFDKLSVGGCVAFHDVYKRPEDAVGPRTFLDEIADSGFVDVVFFGPELFDHFSYIEDNFDAHRISAKWRDHNYSYAHPSADPKSLMAVAFKTKDS